MEKWREVAGEKEVGRREDMAEAPTGRQGQETE